MNGAEIASLVTGIVGLLAAAAAWLRADVATRTAKAAKAAADKPRA